MAKVNCDILGESNPELVSNLDRVKLILEVEADSLRQQEKEGEKLWPHFLKDYPQVKAGVVGLLSTINV